MRHFIHQYGTPIWLVAISVSLWLGQHRLEHVSDQQRQGRADALAVACATNSAVIDAGRQIILAGAVAEPQPLESNLRALGLPSLAARKAAAEQAARQYALQIAGAVEKQTHITGLITPDGRVICARLRQIAHAN